MNKKRMNTLFQQAMKYAHDNPEEGRNMASIALYKFGELIEKETLYIAAQEGRLKEMKDEYWKTPPSLKRPKHEPFTEEFKQSKYFKY